MTYQENSDLVDRINEPQNILSIGEQYGNSFAVYHLENKWLRHAINSQVLHRDLFSLSV
jgi:hypothetical protein